MTTMLPGTFLCGIADYFMFSESHESTVWCLAFNKSGKLLASCSADKTIKIWKEYLPSNSRGE